MPAPVSNTELARQLVTRALNDVEGGGEGAAHTELLRFVENELAGYHPQVIAATASYAAQLVIWAALVATGEYSDSEDSPRHRREGRSSRDPRVEQAAALVRDVLLQSAGTEAATPDNGTPNAG